MNIHLRNFSKCDSLRPKKADMKEVGKELSHRVHK
jgi:hypothetical protein